MDKAYQNSIAISSNENLVHNLFQTLGKRNTNKNEDHNNIAVSDNHCKIQVPQQLLLPDMISIIPNSQQNDDTKRLRSNFNCSVDNIMFQSNNVYSFNNISRYYSINPRTPVKRFKIANTIIFHFSVSYYRYTTKGIKNKDQGFFKYNNIKT